MRPIFLQLYFKRDNNKPRFLLWKVFEVQDLFLYIAQYNGLQGAVAQYAADQTSKTKANPFSL